MTRTYVCFYYTGDEPTMSFEYESEHRNGSKANLQDARDYAFRHFCRYTWLHMKIVQTHLK